MARATSDHAFNATIWDVLVDPLYQVWFQTICFLLMQDDMGFAQSSISVLLWIRVAALFL